VRLLVAGIGLIGARHFEHARAMPQIELVGVIDPVTRQSQVPHFASIADVDLEADAIVLATPSHLHAEHARAAARRGWHMLIEKPVAHSLAAADQIVAACDAAGVQSLVGHHRRHHAQVARLKQLMDADAIGQPVVASLIWAMRKPDSYFSDNWRSGAGGSPVMINLVHEVDLLRFLFGDVVQVQAVGSNRVRGASRVESGAAVLHFASGLTATIAFADTTPSPWGFEAGTGENPNIATTGQDYLCVAGTRGAVSFPSMTLWTGAQDWGEAPRLEHKPAAPNVPLVAQLEHFADVVAGRARPLVDAREGRKSLEVTLQIETLVAPCAEVAG
jgi:predicted dehydrogenase